MKSDRLFQLLYLLLSKGALTAPELAEKLEVSVRTVYRDVDALSGAGVPVSTAAGKGGGIALVPGYAFNRVLFNDDEQNRILFAMQSMRAADRSAEELLSKLSGLFQKQSANWIEVDFSRWGYGRVDQKRFELIKTAILEKLTLEIEYVSMAGETTRRRIQPFRLIFKSRSWYVQAWCLRADGFRLFKLSRMLDIRLTDERFGARGDLPPLETDAMETEPAIPVRLLFSASAAYRVYDEFDPPGIKRQADGSLLVQTYLPLDEGMTAYLLTYGAGLRVLEPSLLREQIAATARKIAAMYET
jgi:predicted DNA-binding transcriptional regulator YafY